MPIYGNLSRLERTIPILIKEQKEVIGILLKLGMRHCLTERIEMPNGNMKLELQIY